jgi:hypothetical protein
MHSQVKAKVGSQYDADARMSCLCHIALIFFVSLKIFSTVVVITD